jgi:hypothetical protein
VNLPTDIGKYSVSFWKELGYRSSTTSIPRSLNFKAYHFTTKGGPNGHALWTSLSDLYSLPTDLVDSIKSLGGKVITDRINCLLSSRKILENFFGPIQEGKFRKIIYFPDKEYKVRVVAILDYWSQTVLKPLHHYLMSAMKKIKQDKTFNQGTFKDDLKDCKMFYSIDLTAATDRFPIDLIAIILKGLLPESYVDHWKKIMVNHPFKFKKSRNSEESELSYSTGNPMGAYSSWASFAVAHHYVIYYCCRELNIQWSDSKYCLLGDDIVIGDRDLAEKYLSVIKSLGLEVSALKTHSSPDFYEFAKRLIYKGIEITPFPISALAESESRSYIMTSLLMETENKGWLSAGGIPLNVGLFYSVVKTLPRRLTSGFVKTSYISELMMNFMRDKITATFLINEVIRHNGLILPRLLTDEESEGILCSMTVEAFAESNPENEVALKKKSKPLGLLATNLVIYFTGLEEENDLNLGLECIYALPLLGAYALVEEMFIDLKREAVRIDTKGGGDWPKLMKTLALPLDDTIFVRRQSHVIAQSSAIVGKKLIERLEFFATPTGSAMLG